MAEQLPGRLGADLLGAARAAFTDALVVTVVICAVVVVATAILVATALRPTSGLESAGS